MGKEWVEMALTALPCPEQLVRGMLVGFVWHLGSPQTKFRNSPDSVDKGERNEVRS